MNCFKKRQVFDSLTMEIIIAFGWWRRRLQKEAGGVEPCVLCADPIARTGEEVLYITAHRQLNTKSGRGGIRGFSWHSSSPVLYNIHVVQLVQGDILHYYSQNFIFSK